MSGARVIPLLSPSPARLGLSAVALLACLALPGLVEAQAAPGTPAPPPDQTAAPSDAAPTLSVNPAGADQPQADWTIQVSARYCGGYQIGQGVAIQPQPPLTLSYLTSGSVLFAGQPAQTQTQPQTGVLWVSPAPGQAVSMICMIGPGLAAVDLTGLTNPDPGTYTLNVWTGAEPTPVPLSVTFTPAPPGSGS